MNKVLLEKLRKIIKNVSCNSLKCVYQHQLEEWLEIDSDECNKFIRELVEENLIEEKYDFQCECGNDCTVYHRLLLTEDFQCSECERKHNKDDIKSKAEVLYEIDKQAVMDYKEEYIAINSQIIRKVPMSDETEKAFHRVLKRKLKPMIKEIDGYRHFLFLLENGCPAHNATYKTLLIRMIKKYNKTHDVPLPHITPHTLRHTFCTRLAQKNMNPKNLQYIMGHSNISITLNLYAHASEVGANKEMRSMIA